MDKKKIILISTIIIVGIIIISLIIGSNSKDKEDKTTSTKSGTAELSEVFEIDDIENSQYDIVKEKELKVASKYLENSDKYKLNSSVEFDEDKGTMIYIREDYEKINIYQNGI